MSKHVLRTLGLSLLAALGLMAFAVAGAQAENLPDKTKHVHGHWFILGKLIESAATVTGEAEGAGRLLVPNLGIEINCPSFTVTEASITNTPLGHGTASVIFHECKIFSIEKVLPFNLTSQTPLPCLPLDSVTGADGDIRATALVLLLLHTELPSTPRDYIVFEQLNLEPPPLSVIKYSPETGCPIPLKQEVIGAYAFEVNTGDKHNGGVEVKEPLITAGNHKKLQELFGLTLKYGISEGFLDGSAKLKLTGANLGCTWGGL